jgi:O-antigen ligase
MQFFENRSQMLTIQSSNSTDIVNNIAYNFVSLMPFVFFIKKNKTISILLMVLLILLIIQGAKRGAIFTGAIGLLSYFYFQMFTVDRLNKVRGYLTGLIVVTIVSVFTYYTYISNTFLISRMDAMANSNSSGRDLIYTDIINAFFYSDNILNWFFGFGFAASIKLTGGSYAHNDWLELLSNFGLIGVSLYFYLFYTAFKFFRKIDFNYDEKIVFFVIIAMWFSISLYSMWYTSLGVYPMILLLGYIQGNGNKLLTQNIYENSLRNR